MFVHYYILIHVPMYAIIYLSRGKQKHSDRGKAESAPHTPSNIPVNREVIVRKILGGPQEGADMINSEMIKNLRELMMMKEEIEAEIAAAQDQIKAEMTATNNYEIVGTDYKVTWNEVTTSRIDTKALKAALPEIAKQYTKATTTRRFCLA